MTDFIIGLEREYASILTGGIGLALVCIFYSLVCLYQWRRAKTPHLSADHMPRSDVGPAVYGHLSSHSWGPTGFCAAVLNLAAKGVLSVAEFDDGRFKLTRNAAGDRRANLTPSEAAAIETFFSSGSSLSFVFRAEHHAMTETVRSCFQRSAQEDFETLYFSENKIPLSVGTALSALTLAAMAAVSVHGLAVGMFAIATAMFGFAVYPVALGAWTSWRRGEGAVISLALGLAGLIGLVTLSSNTLSIAVGTWISDAPFMDIFLVTLLTCTNMMFYHMLKSPSLLGRRVKTHVEGLRLYLEGNKDGHTHAQNWPAPTAEDFERFLPYAIALNVEQDWAKQFEHAQHDRSKGPTAGSYAPSWFHSAHHSWPTPVSFVSGFIPLFSAGLARAALSPGHKRDEK